MKGRWTQINSIHLISNFQFQIQFICVHLIFLCVNKSSINSPHCKGVLSCFLSRISENTGIARASHGDIAGSRPDLFVSALALTICLVREAVKRRRCFTPLGCRLTRSASFHRRAKTARARPMNENRVRRGVFAAPIVARIG
jgi:hypothetical protein